MGASHSADEVGSTVDIPVESGEAGSKTCKGAGKFRTCDAPGPGIWSYDYQYDWRIVDSGVATAEQVMDVFKRDPKSVFPFKVEGCDRFYTGATCTLKTGEPNLPDYVPVPYNNVGVVRVTTSSTSVEFTVLSSGYFDAPGSSIEFRTETRDGAVYLSQAAQGHGADLLTIAGVKLIGLSEIAWRAQQKALSSAVGTRYGR